VAIYNQEIALRVCVFELSFPKMTNKQHFSIINVPWQRRMQARIISTLILNHLAGKLSQILNIVFADSGSGVFRFYAADDFHFNAGIHLDIVCVPIKYAVYGLFVIYLS
jgi:hypothetical protein